jgi:hypothetical protein
MISREQFQGELSKLMDQFGASKFSKRKADLIYLALRDLDYHELTSVIDNIIGNCKFAPTVDDFKDKARSYLINKTKSEPTDCSYCKGSGILSVRKKTGEVGDYAFACICPNGKQYPAFPKWHDSYQKTFTRQYVPMKLTREFYGLPE